MTPSGQAANQPCRSPKGLAALSKPKPERIGHAITVGSVPEGFRPHHHALGDEPAPKRHPRCRYLPPPTMVGCRSPRAKSSVKQTTHESPSVNSAKPEPVGLGVHRSGPRHTPGGMATKRRAGQWPEPSTLPPFSRGESPCSQPSKPPKATPAKSPLRSAAAERHWNDWPTVQTCQRDESKLKPVFSKRPTTDASSTARSQHGANPTNTRAFHFAGGAARVVSDNPIRASHGATFTEAVVLDRPEGPTRTNGPRQGTRWRLP